jgi:aerobic-type carbon monoxide dehydrogenase small subunit (CoxS/CutS family)
LKKRLRFRLNGREVDVLAPPMKRLLDVLREECGLTGTKYGCGEGECGACTVRVDGEAVMSCLVPVVQVEGSEVMTVEGLALNGALNTLQQAFWECGGAQCGICTPGMLMAAWDHLESGGALDDDSIRTALAGNICRCTGYTKILEAVRRAGLARIGSRK